MNQFPFVTCISVLAHIPNHNEAVRNMIGLVEDHGHLVLTFPYNERNYHHNIYSHRDAGYHHNIYSHRDAGYGQNASFVTQVYSRKEIEEWTRPGSIKIIEQKYFKVFTGEFWTFGKRIKPPIEVSKDEVHHLTCILLKKVSNDH